MSVASANSTFPETSFLLEAAISEEGPVLNTGASKVIGISINSDMALTYCPPKIFADSFTVEIISSVNSFYCSIWRDTK